MMGDGMEDKNRQSIGWTAEQRSNKRSSQAHLPLRYRLLPPEDDKSSSRPTNLVCLSRAKSSQSIRPKRSSTSKLND